jgi:hypothetical protein
MNYTEAALLNDQELLDELNDADARLICARTIIHTSGTVYLVAYIHADDVRTVGARIELMSSDKFVIVDALKELRVDDLITALRVVDPDAQFRVEYETLDLRVEA